MKQKFKYLFIVIIVLISLLINIVHAFNSNDFHLDIVLLNQDPDPAEPGKYVELRWKVSKFGNAEINNLEFILEPNYPFSFDASDTPIKRVGSWWGTNLNNEYYTLYYKLYVDENAVKGTYDLNLGYRINGGQIIRYKDRFNIRVDESNVPVLTRGNIITSPARLLPDSDENKIEIQINNVGQGDAQNVHVKLDMPQGFSSTYSYSDEAFLGNIKSSDDANAIFYIDIDRTIKSEHYNANIKLTYSETNSNKILSKTIPIVLDIKNKPTFSIEGIQFNENNIKPGDKVNLLIAIKNIGNKKAENVAIRAFRDSSQPFDFDERSDFIGTLEPNALGQGIIIIDVDNNAEPKSYILDLEIRSIENGIVYIQEETIIINVNEPDKRNIIPIILIIFLVLIILAVTFFLGVNYANKNKNQKNKK
ncbi:MAG: COG1361 S-layer family protein [Candidatus Woesearchaeota archaeon]